MCDQLRRDLGETQIGWKLGWTSEAMRTALGIDRPNWGTLWDEQVASPSLDLSRFIHPKVEPELVWRAPVDVDGELGSSDVRELGGQWALGIEVVDPRYPSYNFEALDNTADNSSSAAVRFGDFHPFDGALESLEVTFADGDEQRLGLGSQAMGSPYEAVAWLTRSLAEEGLRVRAGDIVFTGGLTAPFDAVSGGHYTLASAALAGTTLTFT